MPVTMRKLGMAMILCLGIAACADDSPTSATSSITTGASPYVRGDLGTLTYRAVDLMLAAAPEITARTSLIVGSIADTENLDKTSALGNIVADMVRTRIVQDGHDASEIRLRRNFSFNKGTGEFLLSRNPKALAVSPSAGAVVTGTYAAGYEKVYVSLKLVSADDAHIIAGADFVVPLREVVGLLPRQT